MKFLSLRQYCLPQVQRVFSQLQAAPQKIQSYIVALNKYTSIFLKGMMKLFPKVIVACKKAGCLCGLFNSCTSYLIQVWKYSRDKLKKKLLANGIVNVLAFFSNRFDHVLVYLALHRIAGCRYFFLHL